MWTMPSVFTVIDGILFIEGEEEEEEEEEEEIFESQITGKHISLKNDVNSLIIDPDISKRAFPASTLYITGGGG